ncbi:MAG: RNA polymerase factor sigma-54 [Candidatus Caldatribacteriota bacterium]|nr:RNA polymerase factor sigma-54 [Candidatus Caldatribacteriota bacterium]
MKQELSLTQKQRLTLSPQLYQSINILQLNLIELRDLVNKELIENPLLEINQEENLVTEKIPQKEENNRLIEERAKDEEKDNPIDWLSYLKGRDYQPFPGRPVFGRENKYESVICYKESLRDYLLGQLGETVTDSLDYKIGEYLIGNIDENGYLKITLETISQDINIDRDKIKELLYLIQSFDPPGVGARNLEECLLIQKKYLGIDDINIEKIIKLFLIDLAKKSYKKIAKRLNITVEKVQYVSDVIRKKFDPKPGRKIGSIKDTQYIIPDVTIQKGLKGEYRIIQNDTFLPQIKINSLYRKILNVSSKSLFRERVKIIQNKEFPNRKIEDTKKYVEEKLNAAKFLIKGVEQRKRTIYRITEILVDYQKDFLNRGILYIKPLTLKVVADKLEIHESTVSRAIHNKNIQTPRGLMGMKFFFSQGVDKTKKNTISSDKVKKLIKGYIEKENHLKPWSDQKLADLLSSKEEINIARRTVTKYRKILKILPSNLRKRFTK